MLAFLALCLVSRFAYSLNDVFTGRLAREYGRIEVAAWRGVALGGLMAPLLFWVPAHAWSALSHHLLELMLVVSLTGVLNVLQLHAARLLPFGVRAAYIVSGMGIGSVTLGWFLLGEHLAPGKAALAFVVLGSSVVASLGSHADHEIKPDILRGSIFALGAAAIMAVVALLVTRLARATHPFLTAWAWEFGAGLVLVLPLAIQSRLARQRWSLVRFSRIALASSPTVVGSGASAVALVMGALGIWGAVAGTQVLFTAVLGALWHREKIGPLRWFCFSLAAASVGTMAVVFR